ncbi:cytochrome P450 71A1-like isoform X3 [Ananas comosus]|uniref:Cytochrome P450 71A1-like isoform X3 n=1 Tax=Ananas comosus TaxID=4615 RepID=A0A6P5EGP9_ANACO|nr:cytochrome P450 71A1-like isoform X3 [Ananas comosus]
MALLHMIASLPFVVLLLLPLLLLTRRKEGSTSLKLPPVPPKLPVIGNLHQLGRLPHHSLSRLSQRYGPLMYLKLGHEPTVVVSSANMAQEILKTHDLECCSRPPRTSHTKLSYGCSDIAFAVYGGPWRELRRISIIELFSAKKIASFQSIREEEVERTMSSISSYSSSSLPVDLSKELIALTSTITCRMAFGRSYHDVGSRFQMILNEAQAVLGGFFIADYLPIIGWADWLTGMRARLEKNFIDLDRFYQQVLDEHLDRAQQQQRDSSEDLVDILLRMQKDEKSLTTDQIKGALMNVFIGGSDTSSATTGWAMTELMRHPQAMEKAQEEVRSLVGSKGKVEESDIDQLHYLKCVVKETMRLHPVVPMLIPRTTLQHFKINGYDVPPNTTILINAWAIGRDGSYWESPEVFKPERFMNSTDLEFAGKDFNMIPFGEGRRICPGKNLGIKTVEIMLANLLYSFDWELPTGTTKEDIDMDETPGVTVHKRHALRLLATKYSSVYS